MKNQSAKFVGFARAMPDVSTFVTPIFSDGETGFLIQELISGAVVGFRKTFVGREFQEIDCELVVNVGDAAIYGFEISPDNIFIGTAKSLRPVLAKHRSEKIDQASPTFSAIQRFFELINDDAKFDIDSSWDIRIFRKYDDRESSAHVAKEEILPGWKIETVPTMIKKFPAENDGNIINSNFGTMKENGLMDSKSHASIASGTHDVGIPRWIQYIQGKIHNSLDVLACKIYRPTNSFAMGECLADEVTTKNGDCLYISWTRNFITILPKRYESSVPIWLTIYPFVEIASEEPPKSLLSFCLYEHEDGRSFEATERMVFVVTSSPI